ncbi:MAG: MarR family transcriptional regulator [Solirubrobacterales bacterium]
MSASPDTQATFIPVSLADQVGYLLSKAHLRVHVAANEALEPLVLTVKHYGLLTLLVHEGPISQGRLGEVMRIDRTTMVALIDELERAGHVDRTRNPEDRRAYALVATASGKRTQREAERLMKRVYDETLAPLSADDRRELQRMLSLIVEGGGARRASRTSPESGGRSSSREAGPVG